MTNIAGLGVDPGWRYTAGLLVIDGRPVDGFTLAPTDSDGMFCRSAHDDMDPAALRRYCERIRTHLDTLYDRASGQGYRVVVGVEQPTWPLYTKNARRYVARMRAFRVTENVAYFVSGLYGGVETFHFDENHPNGKRHLAEHGGNGDMHDYYPKDLCWRRPKTWLVNEEPDTSRDHERSAFDVAMRRVRMAESMLVAA
ncbi:MAG TPA: hypothetical protein VFN19_09030 [Candidatus Nanopelagicales bacterium]|nr:hypothetical protein [Candidatus Nanopelagicales bacterium]